MINPVKTWLIVLMHELKALKRRAREYLQTLLFFILIVVIFPLGIGSDSAVLQALAPGIVWVAALLACLLSLDVLFAADFATGFVDKLLLSRQSLTLLLLAKITAHWLVTGLPLVVIAPLLGILLQLSGTAEWVLTLSLLLGTPILSLIGSVGIALTLGIKQSGLLLPLLVLPLFIPVLVIGASSVVAANQGLPFSGQLWFLSGLLLLSLLTVPPVAAMALRIGVYQ
jgi:heme exporter protein B